MNEKNLNGKGKYLVKAVDQTLKKGSMKNTGGTSLVFQRLRLCTSTAGNTGDMFTWELRCHILWSATKRRIKDKNCKINYNCNKWRIHNVQHGIKNKTLEGGVKNAVFRRCWILNHYQLNKNIINIMYPFIMYINNISIYMNLMVTTNQKPTIDNTQ